MLSYTYHPQALYTAGQDPRTYSLRSNTLSRPPAPRRRSLVVQPEIPEELDPALTVTTKTTKVVDAAGRTTSITIETIKALPDGSNIIETRTTNISRPGSRSNSFQAGPQSHAQINAYNLNKIEEDLQDFDYTYLDHVALRSGRENPITPAPELRPPEPQTPRGLPARLDGPAEPRLNLISSHRSNGRLKSILKTTPSSGNVPTSALPERVLDVPPAELTEPLKSDLQAPPPLAANTQASAVSGLNSIKFNEQVTTIPSSHYNMEELGREELKRQESQKRENVDLYSKAMQVAMNKVYGPPATSPEQERGAEAQVQEFAQKKSEKKIKQDDKLSKVEANGVSKNYIYENHHKDFSMRSMRDAPQQLTSHKERVKKESKQLKEEEKRHQDIIKAAEKEKKKQDKQAKSQKSAFGLLRIKRRNSVLEPATVTLEDSTLMSIDSRDPAISDPPQASLDPKPPTDPNLTQSSLDPGSVNPSDQHQQPAAKPVLVLEETPVMSPPAIDTPTTMRESEDEFVDVPEAFEEEAAATRHEALSAKPLVVEPIGGSELANLVTSMNEKMGSDDTIPIPEASHSRALGLNGQNSPVNDVTTNLKTTVESLQPLPEPDLENLGRNRLEDAPRGQTVAASGLSEPGSAGVGSVHAGTKHDIDLSEPDDPHDVLLESKTSAPKVKAKRFGKFRKVIDKYFIHNYSSK